MSAVNLVTRTLRRLEQASNHLKAGKHPEAMVQCRRIAAENADSAAILHICAQVAQQCGHLEAALQWSKDAVAGDASHPEYEFAMGQILFQMQDVDQAMACFNGVLNTNPDHVAACFQLGLCWLEKGHPQQALSYFAQSIRKAPHHANAFYWSGVAYSRQGRFPMAVDCLEQSIALDPKHAEARYQLGLVHQEAGNLALSRDCYGRYLDMRPDDWRAMVNLCLVLRELGELASARLYGERATSLKPDSFQAWHNLGNVHKDMQRYGEAVACYEKALTIHPASELSHAGLGIAYQRNGAFDRAEKAFKAALQCNPGSGTAIVNLLNMAMMACDWDRSRDYADSVHELTTASLRKGELPSETPFINLARCPDPAINLAVARAWSGSIAHKLDDARRSLRFAYRRDGRLPIRIGYLSNNFGDHPTAHLTRRLYQLHDRSRFEIFCLSYGDDDNSPYRRAIQNGCDRFVDIRDASPVEAAKRINDLGIDILVDLVGFMKGQRMAIAALRPAPIQVRWLGMAGTSGADFFDYLITDPVVTPPGDASFYTEKFIYLPHCYQINDNQPPVEKTACRRANAGIPEKAFVFSSFNTSYKIDPAIFEVWMRILHRSPGSVLWLMEGSGQMRANVAQAAQACGVDTQRLIFAPKLPKAAHLSRLALADLVLDTCRVSGAASTSDALWAGVPVLTVRGNHFASRMSSSIVGAAGLPELVARDLSDYEDQAVAIAENKGLRQNLKLKLEATIRESHLFDTERFVDHLENGYEMISRIYIEGKPPRLVSAP